MGTHYTVYIFDDHLGLLDSRTGPEEAEHINKKFAIENVKVFRPFEYISVGDCIIGELRKDMPENYLHIFTYDAVYYRTDCSSKLNRLVPQGEK